MRRAHDGGGNDREGWLAQSQQKRTIPVEDGGESVAEQEDDNGGIGGSRVCTVNEGDDPPAQRGQHATRGESPRGGDDRDAAQETFGRVPLGARDGPGQFGVGRPDEGFDGQGGEIDDRKSEFKIADFHLRRERGEEERSRVAYHKIDRAVQVGVERETEDTAPVADKRQGGAPPIRA